MKQDRGVILDVTPYDERPEREFLEKLGHPVLVCHGIEWGHACPLLKGGCELLDDAHGVIFQLDLERPQHRVILDRYKQKLDDGEPIMVVVPEEQVDKYADLLEGVEVCTDRPSSTQLDGFAAEVESADDYKESETRSA